jgi:hypothetical protein
MTTANFTDDQVEAIRRVVRDEISRWSHEQAKRLEEARPFTTAKSATEESEPE